MYFSPSSSICNRCFNQLLHKSNSGLTDIIALGAMPLNGEGIYQLPQKLIKLVILDTWNIKCN